MSKRVDRLEDRAEGARVRRAAARIGADIGCSPEELIADAERLVESIELHGRARAIEILAASVGMTAEQLETGAERFHAMVAEA